MSGASDVRLPPGVRDFLPRATERRTQIAREILERFDRWGYQRIITPQIEVAGVLERGLGSAASQRAVRFIEPTSGDVALLRPDITPQVARIAATRLDETGGPLRLCYSGTVVRDGGGARLQREILQAGIELIGAPSVAGDSEIVAMAAEVLLAARGSSDAATRLEVGHVGPVEALLAAAGEELRTEISAALASRSTSKLVALTAGLADDLAAALTLLPRLSGRLESLEPRITKPFAKAFEEIRSIIDGARRLAPTAMKRVGVIVDLGEVGGFPYYTGPRVAGWLDGVGDAILVGGRYDKLVSRFGRDREATGFAVDIEAVAEARLAGGEEPNGRGVLVVDRVGRGDGIAARLRAAGVRAAASLQNSRGKRPPIKYARLSGFASVLFVEADGVELHSGGAVTKVPKAVIAKLRRGDRAAARRIRQLIRDSERKS